MTDTGIYGMDLLKAMDLNRFYPTDSHFSDDVSMYGYEGIIERLIGHCQSYACYASQDEDNKDFEYHKQIALVLKETAERLNEIDSKMNIKKPDGRL